MSGGVVLAAVALWTAFGAFWGLRVARHADGGHFFAPRTSAAIGRWAAGYFLFAVIVLISVVLIRTGGCAAADGSGAMNLEGCSAGLRGWFSVLTAWQGGIGAAIGLLGLAWAAAYRASNETAKGA